MKRSRIGCDPSIVRWGDAVAEVNLSTRIAPEVYRRLKLETAMSGETIQQFVHEALVALLTERETDRKQVARA